MPEPDDVIVAESRTVMVRLLVKKASTVLGAATMVEGLIAGKNSDFEVMGIDIMDMPIMLEPVEDMPEEGP